MLNKIFFTLLIWQGFILSAQSQTAAHKPADLLKILKASKMTYTVSDLNTDIPKADYSTLVNSPNMMHEDSNGQFVAKKVVRARAADSEWNAAEGFFKDDSNYKEARAHYRSVLDIDPDYYPAKIRIAQTFELEKDYEKAEANYKQAISKNFVDYLPHQLAADNYLREKKYEEAVDEISVASVLNRNDTSVQADLVRIYDKTRMKYGDWTFTPQYKLEKGQKDNEIMVQVKRGWYGYAIAKAIWKYEPGYAQAENTDNVALTHERECLLNLLAGHDSIKAKNVDPSISALADAQDYKLMDGFIYYEILLPAHPSLVYQLPNNVIKSIRDYTVLGRGGLPPKKK